MPFYDYKCKNNHVKEKLHGINDKPDVICDECGEKMVKQFPLGVSIVRGASQDGGLTSSKTDLLRHQAKHIAEAQGGL